MLQIELVKLQRHFIECNDRILILLEGRDGAGSDGSIKRLVEHLSPRETRVVALGKPSDRDRTGWYFQRYVPHPPVGEELVVFNRSWYNRAGVEPVMGFCTAEEHEESANSVPKFEEMLVNSGIKLLKYYLDIGKKEQSRRLGERRRDPLKQWKSSPVDAVALKHWDGLYTGARRDVHAHPYGRGALVCRARRQQTVGEAQPDQRHPLPAALRRQEAQGHRSRPGDRLRVLAGLPGLGPTRSLRPRTQRTGRTAMKSINVEVGGLVSSLSAEGVRRKLPQASRRPSVQVSTMLREAQRSISMRDNSVSRICASASPNAAITAVASRRPSTCARPPLASLPTPAMRCTAITAHPHVRRKRWGMRGTTRMPPPRPHARRLRPRRPPPMLRTRPTQATLRWTT
ncbi:hypothetical protein ACPA9J_03440 [Pseudomonas aeruginosa]